MKRLWATTAPISYLIGNLLYQRAFRENTRSILLGGMKLDAKNQKIKMTKRGWVCRTLRESAFLVAKGVLQGHRLIVFAFAGSAGGGVQCMPPVCAS